MVLLEHCDRKWQEALQLERRSAARVADPLPSTADAARRRYRRQTPIEVPRLISSESVLRLFRNPSVLEIPNGRSDNNNAPAGEAA